MDKEFADEDVAQGEMLCEAFFSSAFGDCERFGWKMLSALNDGRRF